MSYKLIYILIMLFLITLSYQAHAKTTISFDENGKWGTNFSKDDYPKPCSPRGWDCEYNANCNDYEDTGDGLTHSSSYKCIGSEIDGCGYCTFVGPEANNPISDGEYGNRFWVGDGHNKNSGSTHVYFPERQDELWIRWYMRYQEGFHWANNSIHYNKVLYIRNPAASGLATIPSLLTTSWSFSAQGTGAYQNLNQFAGGGWDSTYGPGESDGNWYCFEIYMKMDTAGIADEDGPTGSNHEEFNGVARLWINGKLLGEKTNINYSSKADYNSAQIVDARKGWSWFDFNQNQNEVDNVNGSLGDSPAYVDFDDIIIYNSAPPNIDKNGNPFIGPIGWENDALYEDLSPPENLRINSE